MTDLESWLPRALDELRAELRDDERWSKKLAGPLRVHLAVFVEPWLSWLLDGTKTIESRWSMRRTVPYQRVAPGDVILLKASSGPVRGVCEVAQAWFFDLEETPLAEVRRRFGKAIAGDDAFWRSVRGSRYVSLLEVAAPRSISPFACPKRDRRGWVVL